MRPGMECVLEVLRGDANRRVVPVSEWQQAFQIAEEESILPFFAAKLRQSGVTLPDPIQLDLLQAEQDAVRNGFWWTSELKGILQAFADNHIPVIPLKGPMFAESIYGSINLRASRDIDLLVRPEHLPVAKSELEKLGFARHRGGYDDKFFRGLTGHRGCYDDKFFRGATLVELHFDVAIPQAYNFGTASAWTRARQKEFLGIPVWLFTPSDQLLFICLHGVRHQFERLSNVLDVALALNRLTPQIHPEEFEHGTASQLRHLIVLSRTVAMHLDPHCNPGPSIDLRSGTIAQMNKLAHRMWTNLLDRPSPKQTNLAFLRFYCGLEAMTSGGLLRCARYVCFRATILHPTDFAFAERFGIKRCVLVWILRQFRLLALLCGVDMQKRTRPEHSRNPA